MCSSLFVQFSHTNAHVFQMIKKDGTPWFSLELSSLVRAQYQSEIDKKSELVELWYQHPLSGKKLPLSFPETGIQSDLMLRAVRAPRADSWSPHEDRFGFLVEFYPILM